MGLAYGSLSWKLNQHLQLQVILDLKVLPFSLLGTLWAT